MHELWVCHLGTVEYREALDLQERVAEARRDGRVPDTLLLLEHPAVITRGRRAAAEDLPLPEAWYAERGIALVDVNRGGKLTYHGPGQLVGYPIVAVTDVVEHVRRLERSLVAGLADQGVDAHVRTADGPDFTGVWVAERKIASIGVHVARGVTTHGFALNVVNDLAPFTWFTACGLAAVTMTSVARERNATPDGCAGLLGCARKLAGHRLAEAMGARQRLITPAALERALRTGPEPAGPTARPEYAFSRP